MNILTSHDSSYVHIRGSFLLKFSYVSHHEFSTRSVSYSEVSGSHGKYKYQGQHIELDPEDRKAFRTRWAADAQNSRPDEVFFSTSFLAPSFHHIDKSMTRSLNDEPAPQAIHWDRPGPTLAYKSRGRLVAITHRKYYAPCSQGCSAGRFHCGASWHYGPFRRSPIPETWMCGRWGAALLAHWSVQSRCQDEVVRT